MQAKGDYPFIGSLYNEFGYQRVLSGIHELALAAVTTQLVKPLIYLKAILKRAGPDAQGRLKVLPGTTPTEEEDDRLNGIDVNSIADEESLVRSWTFDEGGEAVESGPRPSIESRAGSAHKKHLRTAGCHSNGGQVKLSPLFFLNKGRRSAR